MAYDRGLKKGNAEMARRMAATRAHLHDGVPLARVADDVGVSLRTVQRWLALYTAKVRRASHGRAGRKLAPGPSRTNWSN